MSPDSLDWTSDVDGVVGTGTTVETSLSSDTTHQVVLTATDSDGASDSDSITVGVQPPEGSVEVITSSSGVDLDPDGYSATLTGVDNDSTTTVGTNDTVVFEAVPEGTVSVNLTDVIVNCVTTNSHSQNAEISPGDTTQLTFSASCDPAGTIAFQTDRNGNTDIYLIKGNGQMARGLQTSDTNLESWPVWGPDGKRIAYHSGSNGRSLTVTNLETGSVTQLTSPNNVGVRRKMGWSPDGSKLVFYGSEELNLYTINRDGSNLNKIVEYTFSPLEAKWSPSGGRLAFTARIDPEPQSAWTVRPDGTNLVKLIDNAFNSFYPDWSPDGNRVVFVSQHVGLFTSNPDTTDRTQITEDDEAYSPEWSPSGDRIVFEQANNLFVVNDDGTGKRQLTDSEAEDAHPAWSPDGSRIVFVSDRTGYWNIFAIRASGQNLTQLTDNSATDARPTWRPNP